MKRYKPIIDDWEQFKTSCEKEALTTVRRNSIKAAKDFEDRLKNSFPEVKKTGWNPDVYRLPETEYPGKSALYWLGDYYVQEESATLPVEVLSPEKGEKILDIAAAPGGKTTQIADKIDNDGLVVANDKSSRRMQSLHANIYRTGSICVNAVNYDGRRIPENEKFDRVLVDAPCTGEGDKARRTFKPAPQNEVKGLSTLQKQLMEKAANLVKQGGTVVYSTCTLAPEENEEVVKETLVSTDLELEEVETDIEHVRGVTEFEDNFYGEEMKKTVRVYPHHIDSGVIYVAKFRKQ